MQIVGGLSGLAFLLAAIGIYGMLSFSTAQRTGEIGLRLAMGAGTDRIMRMVIGEGMMLAAAGHHRPGGGAGDAPWDRRAALRCVASGPADPRGDSSLAARGRAAGLLHAARRATKVDPLTALRAQ